MKELELQLQVHLKHLFRRIWIGETKGTRSLCITLFPANLNAKYQILVEYFWLKENEPTFDNILKFIENKIAC